MKVLVTGGAGFIGSNLVKKLSDLGIDTVVADDMSSSRKDFHDFRKTVQEIEFINCCFSDDIILDRIRLKEFYCVFHIAAVPRVSFSVEQPFLTTDINVLRTTKLLEACIDNIERFVFSSSSSVYGGAEILPTPVDTSKSPQSPYAWQKSCIEDLLVLFSKLYSMDTVSLRYFNVFGPGQFGDSAYSTAVSAWCHAIKNNLPLRKDGTGEQSRDMCFVDNIVQANIKSLNFPGHFHGEKFNIACQDKVTNNEILEFLHKKFPNIEIKNAAFRKGDVMHTLADISQSKEALGYNPTVSFWQGMDQTLAWWSLT